MQASICWIMILHFFILLKTSNTKSSIINKYQNQIQQTVPNLSIRLQYQTQSTTNKTITKQVTIYNNSILSSQFQITSSQLNKFSCANLQLYSIQQYNQQVINSSAYYLIFYNFLADLYVELVPKYEEPKFSPVNYVCLYNTSNGTLCSLQVTNECVSNPKLFNKITGTITYATGAQILQFQYNFICDQQAYAKTQPIQWGALIMLIFSIFMLFICSKFQHTRSYNNPALYMNYPIIIFLNVISIIKFILVGKDIPTNVQNLIQKICIVLAIMIGIPAFMVCFCQFVYMLKIRWLRNVLNKKHKIKVRVMDCIGFILGIGIMVGWFFTPSNWIFSDFIFIFIYVVLIKTIKFGSLKIALATFSCSLLLSIVFIVFSVKTSIYVDENNFNNPLYLLAPIDARVVNVRCSWYFIIPMAYPGMFLAFLQRFDKNKGAILYSPTFLVCYGIFSIAWFIVGSFVPIPLPYDLFTVPISMALLLLFANRRGQLDDLWTGRFFDQQKNFVQNQRQMMQHLSIQKTVSGINYQKQMFQNLKFGEKSQDSKSQRSKFSQIIVKRQYKNQQIYIYSQGDQLNKNIYRDSSNSQQRNTYVMNQKQFSKNWTIEQKS